MLRALLITAANPFVSHIAVGLVCLVIGKGWGHFMEMTKPPGYDRE